MHDEGQSPPRAGDGSSASGPERLAPRPLTEPHPDRLPMAFPGRQQILAAHAGAMDRQEAGYLDPSTGLFVLTALFLAKRGTCCERGCRHCPYVT